MLQASGLKKQREETHEIQAVNRPGSIVPNHSCDVLTCPKKAADFYKLQSLTRRIADAKSCQRLPKDKQTRKDCLQAASQERAVTRAKHSVMACLRRIIK